MTRFLFISLLICLALPACESKTSSAAVKIGFMPKLVGITYFNACRKGAEEAAKELGIELTYDGPNKADVNAQIDMLNQWVAGGDYASIVVACNDPDRIA